MEVFCRGKMSRVKTCLTDEFYIRQTDERRFFKNKNFFELPSIYTILFIHPSSVTRHQASDASQFLINAGPAGTWNFSKDTDIYLFLSLSINTKFTPGLNLIKVEKVFTHVLETYFIIPLEILHIPKKFQFQYIP